MYLSYVILLALIGYAIALTHFFKLKIERTLFIVIPLTILLLYFGALIGILQQMATALFVLGLAAFLLSPVYLRKELKSPGVLTEKYITPGIVLSLIVLILMQTFALHLYYSRWDEFTQWGPHIKLLFINHQLWTFNNAPVHAAYPPGGALFQYFYGQLSGFSEGLSYAAQTLLIYSPLFLLTENIRWKHWINAALIAILSVLFIGLFNIKILGQGSVYMDTPVGIYFGMCIVHYLLSKRKISSILFLLPALCTLMLFKINLMPLVIIIAAVILIDQFLTNKSINKKRAAFALFILVAAAWLVGISWLSYLKHVHIGTEYNLMININKIDPVVIKTFLHAISTTPLYNLIGFVVLIAVNVYCVSSKSAKKSLYLTHSCLLLGYFAFTFGLLLLYLFSPSFTASGSKSLISFERYMSIYYVAWGLAIFAGYVELLKTYKPKLSKYRYATGALLFVIFISIAFLNEHHNKKYARAVKQHNAIAVMVQQIKQHTNKNDTVYSVWQHSGGEEIAQITMGLMPRSPSNSCYSISMGAAYSSSDVWTCKNISAQKFLNQIKSYHYLLLAHTDKKFWHDYGALFDKNNRVPLTHYMLNGTTQPSYLFKITPINDKIFLKNVMARPS